MSEVGFGGRLSEVGFGGCCGDRSEGMSKGGSCSNALERGSDPKFGLSFNIVITAVHCKIIRRGRGGCWQKAAEV